MLVSCCLICIVHYYALKRVICIYVDNSVLSLSLRFIGLLAISTVRQWSKYIAGIISPKEMSLMEPSNIAFCCVLALRPVYMHM